MRSRRRDGVRLWIGPVLLLVLAGATGARAAGKTAAFKVTALHSSMGSQVTVTSRVWITETQARAEVTHPLEGKAIFLVTGGYFYQLDPTTKKGVKEALPPEMKASKDNFEFLMARFAFNAQDAIRKSKKVRAERFGGHLCDVYQSSETRPEGKASLTIWSPQKLTPSIPLRAVMTQKVVKPGATLETRLDITLSELQVNTALSPSLFTPPAGYEIKSGQAGVGAPPRPGAVPGKAPVAAPKPK